MFEKMKAAYEALRHNIRVYTFAMKDPRTPRLARWLLWLAIGYLLSPIDLIPDFIPVLGHLDDVIIVPALFIMAKRMIPAQVLDDCRKKAVDAREKKGSDPGETVRQRLTASPKKRGQTPFSAAP